jgi:hypothetical protein
MTNFKINGTDFSHLVANLKVGYETLVSDDSGRNAKGDMVIDIVSRKRKVYVTFRPMNGAEMTSLLSAIGDYVINITYLNPKTNALVTIKTYTGTPEPDYYWTHTNEKMFRPMDLNFIEL